MGAKRKPRALHVDIYYDNEVRPYQALFGYQPAIVYRCDNETRLLADHRSNVEKATEKRRQQWLLDDQKLTTLSC
jgi:hypothetical protein